MDANVGQRQVAVWFALLGAVSVLALGVPTLRDTGRGLRHPTAWVDRIGADEAGARLAVAALVLLAGWVAVGLAASALGRLPGLAGRSADRFARLVLPAAPIPRGRSRPNWIFPAWRPARPSARVPGQTPERFKSPSRRRGSKALAAVVKGGAKCVAAASAS